MSIKCTLGLIACLHYGGNTIPADKAVSAIDFCAMVGSTHMTHTRLNALAESIEGVTGKRISWPPRSSEGAKVAAISRECAAFRSAFDDDRAWKNLDKWPF